MSIVQIMHHLPSGPRAEGLHCLVRSLLIQIALVSSTCAVASSYPTKAVRFIMPNTVGTTVDNLGRIVAAKMSESLGQQIVCDNRGGAGGIIGMQLAAKASADGYTLVVTSTGVQVITPQIYKKLPYDPARDFIPISMFALTDNILVSNPAVPSKNVADLIAIAKSKPGELVMSNAGTGFQSHLAGVLFTHLTGLNIRHVPYKGGASLVAVIANESQLTIAPAPSVVPHIRAGKLRALGTGGERPSPFLPDVRPISETVPGYISTGWAGLLAPKGTPKDILNKLHENLAEVLHDASTRKLLETQGAEPWMTSTEEMVRQIKADYKRFGEAIRAANLAPQ